MELSIQKESMAHPEIIDIDGSKYQVHFKVLTICVLTNGAGETIGAGSTQWSPSEPFNYVRGKKLALRSALCKMSKPVRTTIWEAFLTASRERLERQVKMHAKMITKAASAIPVIVRALGEDRAELKRGVFGCAKH